MSATRRSIEEPRVRQLSYIASALNISRPTRHESPKLGICLIGSQDARNARPYGLAYSCRFALMIRTDIIRDDNEKFLRELRTLSLLIHSCLSSSH
jgi:1-acyl-sn-glycerol-3-phosphate acyltransferase